MPCIKTHPRTGVPGHRVGGPTKQKQEPNKTEPKHKQKQQTNKKPTKRPLEPFSQNKGLVDASTPLLTAKFWVQAIYTELLHLAGIGRGKIVSLEATT